MGNEKPNARHSWFAVWRWPKWTRYLILPLSFVTYLASPSPTLYVLFAMNAPKSAFRIHRAVFSPVHTYFDCWPVQMINTVEMIMLTEMFGEPGE